MPAPPLRPWTSWPSAHSHRSVSSLPIATDISANRAAARFPRGGIHTRAWPLSQPGTCRIIGKAGCRGGCSLPPTTRRKVSSRPPTKSKTRRVSRCWSRRSRTTIDSAALSELLRQLPQATLHEIRQMQYDVVSVQAEELLDVVMPHLPDGPLKDKTGSVGFRLSSRPAPRLPSFSSCIAI